MSCNGGQSATICLYSFTFMNLTKVETHGQKSHTHTHKAHRMYSSGVWSLDDNGTSKMQITTQKPTVDVSMASTKGWTWNMVNGWWAVWYQVVWRDQTGNWKLWERWQRDRDRLTICVLVVISWEEEREAKRKSNTKVRGKEEEEEKARRRKS